MIKVILQEMRITQWIKNGFIFVALILSSNLFDLELLITVIYAFFIFSFLCSGIYILNDIFDVEKDRAHPIKRNRPIAAGKIRITTGLLLSIWLIIISLILALFYINVNFFFLLILYLVIQIAYNIKLKNVIIIDALVITLGFIIRLYAGAISVNVPVSSWLVLSTIGIALLLALGKRRAEANLLKDKNIKFDKTRKLLQKYPTSLLDSLITMSATYSIITYSLFSNFDSPQLTIEEGSLLANYIPHTLSDVRWLLATIPFAIYGVARYLYIIYEKNEGESPHKSIVTDRSMIVNIVIWLSIIITVFYIL